MPISQLGQINTTALIVPNVRVQIVPPQTNFLTGVPTNILGVVGSASWGPVNAPVSVGNMADFAENFGAIKNRKHDLGTAVVVAVLQGANAFKCVRVTDGTEVAASVNVEDGAPTPAYGVSITAKYEGTVGDELVVSLKDGTNSTAADPTFRLTVAMPGRVSEVFDNIGGTAADASTEGSLWANVIDAINNGQNALRGPSQLVVASVPTTNLSSIRPLALNDFTLSGGADGSIEGGTAAQIRGSLLGADAALRTGMYALRGSGASVLNLSDLDDHDAYSTLASFCLSEGMYGVVSTPPGDAISQAIADKKSAGLDTYGVKLMFGDWCLYDDTVNGKVRAVAPASYAAGKIAALSPEQSALNKPLLGLIGTQSASAGTTYSEAELQELALNGIDVITNPVPGGDYYGVRVGHNSSSDPMVRGDNYTRMTNYIAVTLDAGMGKFIGRLQSVETRRQCKATLEAFLSDMQSQNQIGNADGTTPYSVQLDSANNPPSRVALGYMQADVKVQYLSVIEHLLINVEGGQSVTIERLSTAPAA